MAKTTQTTFQTLCVWLSGFIALNGIPPTLEVNNGKVVFTFPVSENLYRLMMDYNSNVNVPVADYVTMVKSLRGQMLTMRGGQRWRN